MQPVCFGESNIQGCQQEAECAVGLPTSSCAPAQVSDEQSIGIDRHEAEQLAAEMFASDPSTGMTASPTLEEMLVPDSDASVLLATMFTTKKRLVLKT